MPKPKIPKEEKKVRLNVRIQKKLVDQLKLKQCQNETFTDLIERIILNFLKNN